MASDVYRARIVGNIRAAIAKSAEAERVDHHGLRGRIREIAVDELLKPILPRRFEIATGKLVDSTGAESAEIDLIVYNPALLPGIMYSAREGLIPIESAFLTIEVKTTLTRTELKSAVANAETVRTLRSADTDVHNWDERVNWKLEHPALDSFVFAFATDLAPSGDEFERLTELTATEREGHRPAVRALCVAGRGFWWRPDVGQWKAYEPTDEYEEVIDFLARVVSAVGNREHSRSGEGVLGRYITRDERGKVVVPRS